MLLPTGNARIFPNLVLTVDTIIIRVSSQCYGLAHLNSLLCAFGSAISTIDLPAVVRPAHIDMSNEVDRLALRFTG